MTFLVHLLSYTHSNLHLPQIIYFFSFYTMNNLASANQARINKSLDNIQLNHEGKIITLRIYVDTIATKKMKYKKIVQCHACARRTHALGEYIHDDKYRVLYGAGTQKSFYEIPKMVFDLLELPQELSTLQ